MISRNGYTDQEIIDALNDERREFDFRVDLLNASNVKQREITTIDSLSVTYDKQDRDINRTFKVEFKDDLGFTERFEFDHSADWLSYGDVAATWDWETFDDELVATGGTNAAYIRDGISYTDVDIEVDSDVAYQGGIVARFQDSNNYYVLVFCDDSGATASTNLIIKKRVNGTFTSLGTADVTWVSGIPHTLRFRVIGSRLQAAFDGLIVVDVTDTAISSAGGVGLYNNTSGHSANFQELRVDSEDTINFLTSRMQPVVKLLMPSLTAYTATTQADFNGGTLSSVTANSAGTLTLGASAPYNTSGNWVSTAYSIDAVGYLKSCIISWIADVPAACGLTVDVKIGSGSYMRATNGGPVPGMSVGDDLTGKTVTLKVSMTTSDTSQTPTLSDISVRFLSANNTTYIEFAQGVFVMPTAKPVSAAPGNVTYQVDGYDLNYLLGDTVTKDRYYVAASTNYVTAIKAALGTAGITSYNIDANSSILATSLEWEPGTSFYQIIDDLCVALGYIHYFDENGLFVAQAWVNPFQQTPVFSFITGKQSLVEADASLEFDAYGVPNTVVLIVSEPELTSPLRSEVSNNNPASPTSIPSRGREIVKVIKDVQAPDQTTLDAIAAQTLFELSQIYESVELKVGTVPFLGHNDTVRIEFDPFRIRDSYEVTGWEIEMKTGGQMKLNVRRIVTV